MLGRFYRFYEQMLAKFTGSFAFWVCFSEFCVYFEILLYYLYPY